MRHVLLLIRFQQGIPRPPREDRLTSLHDDLTTDVSTVTQGTPFSGKTVTKTPISGFSPRSRWYILGLPNMTQVLRSPFLDPGLED